MNTFLAIIIIGCILLIFSIIIVVRVTQTYNNINRLNNTFINFDSNLTKFMKCYDNNVKVIIQKWDNINKHLNKLTDDIKNFKDNYDKYKETYNKNNECTIKNFKVLENNIEIYIKEMTDWLKEIIDKNNYVYNKNITNFIEVCNKLQYFTGIRIGGNKTIEVKDDKDNKNEDINYTKDIKDKTTNKPKTKK